MSRQLTVAPRAQQQIAAIEDWWFENRRASPHLFQDELAAAFELLTVTPFAGIAYPHRRVSGVRRLLLRATRYHVYYVVGDKWIEVLTVWSAVRGRGPNLTQ